MAGRSASDRSVSDRIVRLGAVLFQAAKSFAHRSLAKPAWRWSETGRAGRQPWRVLVIIAALLLGAAARVPVPHPRPGARPVPPQATAPEGDGITDMSGAVPLRTLLSKPSTAEQYKTLSGSLAKDRDETAKAKAQSDALAAETLALKRKLVASAAKVEALEHEAAALAVQVRTLSAQEGQLAATFLEDRAAVYRVLGVLERLQHDAPPAMAVDSDDALTAARSAMLIGATFPRLYREAAAAAERLARLRQTRTALIKQRRDAAATAVALSGARADLDKLLAQRQVQADQASSRYGVLKTALDTMTLQAGNLQALLQKVARLRGGSHSQAVVVVNGADAPFAPQAANAGPSWRGTLRAPVVGVARPGGFDGVGGKDAPGLTYNTGAKAVVIAPADGKIVYAGTFAKTGRVLILEIEAGYDVLLAGLDRLDVNRGDDVLAGEPVGAMSKFDHDHRLYFELRRDGKGMNPQPYLALVLRKAK